jgi:LacI family transcriptional regulator
MSSTRGDRGREVAALQRLHDRHVDGLIMMSSHPDDGTLAALIDGREDVVLVDEDIPGVHVPRIFVENDAGAYVATRHLIENGHRVIGLIGGQQGLLSVRERLAGFERAMQEAGLSVHKGHVLLGEYSRVFGRKAIEAILESPGAPTAIIACSDYLAVGVLEGLKQKGLSVPDDMSLVGFDDMPFAELMHPALTTVRQPIAALGRLGFQTLLALLNNERPQMMTRLPVELVTRQSVAPPRTTALRR